jgi:hypothetical protein
MNYYDYHAVYFRGFGLYETANYYAELSHQHVTKSGYPPTAPDPLSEDLFRSSQFDHLAWDELTASGLRLPHSRPFGPSKRGSGSCSCGSIASGGTKTYCTCDNCW